MHKLQSLLGLTVHGRQTVRWPNTHRHSKLYSMYRELWSNTLDFKAWYRLEHVYRMSDIECSPCLTQCSPGHHLSKNYTGTDLTLAQCMPCRQCQVGTYRGPSWKPSHHGNLAMAMGSTTRRLTVCRALNVTQGAIRRPLTSPVMEGLS